MSGAVELCAPFPYFGGKRSAAPVIWQMLGDVPSYVEPFAGSAAVLLARPAGHSPVRESINDAAGFVSNFWRAVRADPDAVAEAADYPVIERDLEARHYWLVTEGRARLAALAGDPDAYDAKIAGWWVWGACAWIGSGWCHGGGPWAWTGAEWERNAGQGINRQLPHLGNAGQGINRKLPHLGDAGQGDAIREWFRLLASRLRRTVVCNGDWRRVVASETVLGLNMCPTVGVFLDPPYAAAGITKGLYESEGDVARDVRAWCAEHGADPRKRIVLAGYADEGHAELERLGWRRAPDVRWRNGSGYGNQGAAATNRAREALWCSPACLAAEQEGLFRDAPAAPLPDLSYQRAELFA